MKLQEIIYGEYIEKGIWQNDFNKSWINESPKKVEPLDVYQNIISNIRELYNSSFAVKNIVDFKNGWKKYPGNTISLYWFEDESKDIIIAAEFSKTPHAMKVNLIAKNPKFQGKPPYAMDLYKFVLDDLVYPAIQIDSDIKLTMDGLTIWKRFLDEPNYKIFVYDNNSPGNLIPINSYDDLIKYHNENVSFEKYQYALCKNQAITETEILFKRRKYFHEKNYLWD